MWFFCVVPTGFLRYWCVYMNVWERQCSRDTSMMLVRHSEDYRNTFDIEGNVMFLKQHLTYVEYLFQWFPSRVMYFDCQWPLWILLWWVSCSDFSSMCLMSVGSGSTDLWLWGKGLLTVASVGFIKFRNQKLQVTCMFNTSATLKL